MTRTQIQLPDALYERAKRAAAEREISLAELTRRGLEMLLDRLPTEPPSLKEWKLPKFNGGGSKVPLSKLHDIAADDGSSRGLPRR
jgi:hypothetical protein